MAIFKAKDAVSSASSWQAFGHSDGMQILQKSLNSAKQRLEIEQQRDALHKVVHSATTLSDLPKLEAAILKAKKSSLNDPDLLK